LREVKDKLQAGCRKEVFKVQLDAAYDYRADKMLHEACEKDAETLCKGVKIGGGRIQACLVSGVCPGLCCLTGVVMLGVCHEILEHLKHLHKWLLLHQT
jgi:hypothetical protein